MEDKYYRPPGHGEYDIAEIGTINLDDEIFSEAEIGGNNRFNVSGIGEMKVLVYGPDEVAIPHFHIVSKNGDFQACICIYSANFFSHGCAYKNILNNKQCRKLNKWIQSKSNIDVVNLTNWQSIVIAWENNNPYCKFPESRKTKIQPHYENMTQFKDL